jgi:predicted ribosomally synthesized peptide with SipW-like signal peptide
MKKILLSLVTIGAVAALAVGASRAYFSDTEKSVGNTFTTGTIDIAVDGQNPWAKSYTMADMKPSQVNYINFVVHNVGTNPVDLSKTLDNFAESENAQSESKCAAISGTWSTASQTCSGGTLPTDMQNTIRYDLRVELYNTNPSADSQAKPYWWETIYQDSDNIRVGSLPKPMYLGMIPVGHYMKVIQSYHMDSETGNNYQGEKLTFDITLDAKQLVGTVRLEDKYLSNTDVSHQVWLNGGLTNGKDATLTYGVKDNSFHYTLAVKGMTDGPYTLVTWEDSLLQWTWGSFAGTTVLANVTVSGGVANISGSIDLNKDLVNAKVWLVPGNLGAPGATAVSLPWDPTNTLFETGLMNYYDSVK